VPLIGEYAGRCESSELSEFNSHANEGTRFFRGDKGCFVSRAVGDAQHAAFGDPAAEFAIKGTGCFHADISIER